MTHAEGIRRYDSMGEAVGAAMRRNAERAAEAAAATAAVAEQERLNRAAEEAMRS